MSSLGAIEVGPICTYPQSARVRYRYHKMNGGVRWFRSMELLSGRDVRRCSRHFENWLPFSIGHRIWPVIVKYGRVVVLLLEYEVRWRGHPSTMPV